jgi:Tfp pilus assembly protein PilN
VTTTVAVEPELTLNPVGLLPIVANLLPQEVTDLRRVRQVRRGAALGLAAVILIVAGWDVHARSQTSSARSSLADLQSQSTSLQHQSAQFAPLQRIQEQTESLNSALKGLATDNLPWYTLLPSLNSVAHHYRNASFDTITGQLTGAGAGDTTPTLPSETADASVGTVTLSGTAPDKSTIAAIVDALGAVHGIANAYLTGANQVSGGSYQFTITADITSAVLGGQFGSLSAPKVGAK